MWSQNTGIGCLNIFISYFFDLFPVNSYAQWSILRDEICFDCEKKIIGFSELIKLDFIVTQQQIYNHESKK